VNKRDLRGLTADIVTAYSARHRTSPRDLGALISTVHTALSSLTAPAAPPTSKRIAAVPVKRSIAPGHLTCLECGVRLKILKRHLRAVHNLTPQGYRERWDLPPDYPVVAPAYAADRAAHARSMGLGKRKSR
jgi:predicted transcriptional regulator